MHARLTLVFCVHYILLHTCIIILPVQDHTVPPKLFFAVLQQLYVRATCVRIQKLHGRFYTTQPQIMFFVKTKLSSVWVDSTMYSQLDVDGKFEHQHRLSL